MKFFLILFISFSFINFSIAAEIGSKEIKMPKTFISGDPEKGSQLVDSCAACHGADGNSLVGMWPTLAGQRELYLFDQLHHIQ